MLTVDHPVLAFCLVVNRRALRVVLAESRAGGNKHSVGLVTHDRDRSHVGYRKIVEAAHGRSAEAAARRLDQVVLLGRLVIDHADPAVSVRAKSTRGGGVSISATIGGARRDDADIQLLAIRLSQDLIE